jgi:pimeloyl-ACP methyl ester carboxylesterase
MMTTSTTSPTNDDDQNATTMSIVAVLCLAALSTALCIAVDLWLNQRAPPPPPTPPRWRVFAAPLDDEQLMRVQACCPSGCVARERWVRKCGAWPGGSVLFVGCPALPEAPRPLPPPLVIMHGEGSSAALLAGSECVAELRRTHLVLLLDTPAEVLMKVVEEGGDFAAALADMLSLLLPAILLLLCDSVDGSDLQRKPVLVGHSFGAFLALAAVSGGADGAVAGLVLVSPVGLLPTLGALGALWATVFGCHAPRLLKLRALEPALTALLTLPLPLLPASAGAPAIAAWLAAQRREASDALAEYFIGRRGDRAFWRRPLLSALLHLRVPVVCVAGARDPLCTFQVLGPLMARLRAACPHFDVMLTLTSQNSIFLARGAGAQEGAAALRSAAALAVARGVAAGSSRRRCKSERRARRAAEAVFAAAETVCARPEDWASGRLDGAAVSQRLRNHLLAQE